MSLNKETKPKPNQIQVNIYKTISTNLIKDHYKPPSESTRALEYTDCISTER